jgi:multiple antibiotic resistance protein
MQGTNASPRGESTARRFADRHGVPDPKLRYTGRARRNRLLQAAKNILLILSALFPIVNPIGDAPFFLALTRQYSDADRMALAKRVTINSFILLVCSFFIGTHILSFFGISIPVVQVGGGLVVIATGWTMLMSKDEDDQPHEGNVKRHVAPEDPLRNAFYPLTLPLTVGPGSISVAITLGANLPRSHGFNLLGILAILIGSAIVSVSILLCYGFSDRLARAVGPTGMSVIIRLSSFLLVCIGVQIFWNGAKALLQSVSGGQ